MNLPPDLLAALSAIAVARGTTVEALVTGVLSDWAQKQAEVQAEANDYAEFDNVEYILALLKGPPSPPE